MKVKLNGDEFFRVTEPFGVVTEVHPNPHTGIDIAMNEGTKLFSLSDGVVDRIVNYGDSNIGKGIIIKTNEGEDLIYGHLSDNSLVKIGQEIQKGDLIGLSGNTGRSTGAHLHLGLKDEGGNFVDPSKYLDDGTKNFNDVIFQKEGIITKLSNTNTSSDAGFMDGIKSFGDFLHKWNETGSFWVAMYDKPFFEVLKDFFAQLGHDIAIFILGNGDIFFLMPAIILMFATFFIGRNKYTKFIIPLWFSYFVSNVLFHLIK